VYDSITYAYRRTERQIHYIHWIVDTYANTHLQMHILFYISTALIPTHSRIYWWQIVIYFSIVKKN